MNSDKMSASLKGVTVNRSAIIAGAGLLLMAVIAPVANFGIFHQLVDFEDSNKTVMNLINSNGLFRGGIALFLLVALLDIVVAWALYIFCRPVNRLLSLLAAWLRIVYAAILCALLIHLVSVLILLGGVDSLGALPAVQLNTQVMLQLKTFTDGWELALILFGFHLLALGLLLLKAGYMRNVLGILLIIAGLGYVADGFGRLLFAGYSFSFSMFTFIGEVVLIFWLFIRGRKIQLVE
jgi:hypothetical protein